MKTYRNPVHYREFIIAGAVSLVMLLFGSLFDFRIGKSVYDQLNTNAFGILFSGIGEWPCYLLLIFSGAGLIASRNVKRKVAVVFSYIVGILAIVIGAVLAWNTFRNISSFANTSSGGWNLFTILFGIALIIACAAPIVYLTIAKGKCFQREVLFRVSFLILLVIVFELLFFSGTKYLWSRPRPRYLFGPDYSGGDPIDGFRQWWQPQAFFAVGQEKSTNFTSFPSGHTASAAVTMIGIPLIISLYPKYREKKWLLILGFYIGMAWTIIVAISRLFAGAHFLSDTAAGMFLTLLVSVIILYVDFAKDKKIELAASSEAAPVPEKEEAEPES